MMTRKTGATAIALWLGMSASVAQAATPPCLTKQDIQTVATAVMPDTLRGLGKACAPSLPEGAILRGGLNALVARFEPGSAAAWPGALQIFANVGGAGDLKGVDPQMLKPMIGPMIAGMFTDKIKPADCATIDRMTTLLAPLPPANLTEALATIVELAGKDKKADKSGFRICPSASATASAPTAPSAHK